jgi:hypothetical protein
MEDGLRTLNLLSRQCRLGSERRDELVPHFQLGSGVLSVMACSRQLTAVDVVISGLTKVRAVGFIAQTFRSAPCFRAVNEKALAAVTTWDSESS